MNGRCLPASFSHSKWHFPIQRSHHPRRNERERRKAVRRAIIAHLNSGEVALDRDLAYIAFFLMKKGRGGEIVGNPRAIRANGKDNHRLLELPYTGLEGYYAGSERTATRPGLTPEEILLEEANIGAELLKAVKRRSIEHDLWIEFARLKRTLDEGRPDAAELKTIQGYFGTVVGRLHVRVYRNPEFDLTLSEQIEQLERLMSEVPGRTSEDKRLRRALQATFDMLKREQESIGAAEREQQRQEHKRREQVRTERLAEFHNFRAETYRLLAASRAGNYEIAVQETSPEDVAISETVTLPAIPLRDAYPPTCVRMTAEQVEGYLFLTGLGELGGDPVVRSIYR